MPTKEKTIRKKDVKIEKIVLNVHITEERIYIADEKSNMLFCIPNNQIRPVINLVSHLIDEDLPGIISKSNLEDNFDFTLRCKVPIEPMFLKE